MASNPIDMPGSPATGDLYSPGNGVTYEWDGEKWVMYIQPGDAQNYWLDDPVNNYLTPITKGEDVALLDTSSNVTIRLTGATGKIDSPNGLLFVEGSRQKYLSVRSTLNDANTEVAKISSAGTLSCLNIAMENFPSLP
jgi:hypothetical protein